TPTIVQSPRAVHRLGDLFQRRIAGFRIEQSEPFGEALAGRGGQFRTCHLPLPFRTGKRFHSLQAGILRGTERGALQVFPHAREAAFSGRDGGRRSIAVGELGSSGSGRSEEHTSELQSRENLVCRLLLEKKNYTRT